MTGRRPIPSRYRVGRYGPRVLMDCRVCRAPFDPGFPVPRDRLCVSCRQQRDEATPVLPGMERYR
ncbi:hypothetical protein SAMN05421776_105350 [Nocardia farcinica]|uniref:DksA C4-type domain-containing protein n=1 Tax=Nocardia farcinica TaxID=37329 RepID=A0A0H5NCW1_NOCFR|nr:hypothetical protein [Nocardia farcinica]MBF6410916.1 hypothetical protein [Nocardia farcinica]PFX04011.1 hypothetical protein CJ469_01885 [Nocardia farcinica]PFX10169.1 hypothetical protein CJ468_01016 [Nocardia farcinica]CRY73675.1 Uncharacterised protein [Nocardia farcinica]SIT24820.1 hypothetical protein SAMN05421776_105350 [Nocardia farcinica]